MIFGYILELLNKEGHKAFFDLQKGACKANNAEKEKRRLAQKGSRAAKRERKCEAPGLWAQVCIPKEGPEAQVRQSQSGRIIQEGARRSGVTNPTPARDDKRPSQITDNAPPTPSTPSETGVDIDSVPPPGECWRVWEWRCDGLNA